MTWFVAELATPKRVAIASSVAMFALYLLTMSPTFGYIDEGELAAVASTMGIAHPTGYPTLTLLGKLWTTIVPVREVLALNMLSALLGSIGVGMFTLLTSRIVRLVCDEQQVNNKSAPTSAIFDGEVAIIGGISSVVVGSTSIWWNQAIGFEVYSLHMLLVPSILLLFLRYVAGEGAIDEQSRRNAGTNGSKIRLNSRGFWFAFVLGLSFTNHMTTVLLAPALLFWFFFRLGFNARSLRRILTLALPFALGLLPYIYLPLRASAAPLFNWGDPSTPWLFWRHITGAQFGVWMFESAGTIVEQTNYIAGVFAEDFAYVGLAVAVAGILFAGKRDRLAMVATPSIVAAICLLYATYSGDSVEALVGSGLAGCILLVVVAVRNRKHMAHFSAPFNVFLGILLITGITYAGGYSIVDIEPYYLTALLAIGIWFATGLLWMRIRLGAAPSYAVAGVLGILLLVLGAPRSNRHDSTEVEMATRDMLSGVPENSVVVSGLWDYWVSGSYYLQGVEGVHADVAVIDHNLIKRSWYLDQLVQWYPEIMGRVQPELDRYRSELYKFEHDLPYDTRKIDGAYVALIDSIMAKTAVHRPVYMTWDLISEGSGTGGLRYGSGFHWVPEGLAFRLQNGDEYRAVRFPDWSIEFSGDEPDIYDGMMRFWYTTMSLQRMAYEERNGKPVIAERYRSLAKSFDPGWTHSDFVDSRTIVSDRVGMILGAFRGASREP